MINKDPILEKIRYCKTHMPFIDDYLDEFQAYSGIRDPEIREREKTLRVRGLEVNMECMEKRPFFTLKHALRDFKPLYLSHNGAIGIALPFEEVVKELGAHENPEEIGVWTQYYYERDDSGTWRKNTRILYGAEFLKRRTQTLYGPRQHVFISDNRVSFPSLYYKLVEYVFNLDKNTFITEITQGGHGARLNSRSRLSGFMSRLAESEVPLIISTGDLQRQSENQMYIVNGMDF